MQAQQQAQLLNLNNVVGELAVQMQEWIQSGDQNENEQEQVQSKPVTRKSNFESRSKSRSKVNRSKSKGADKQSPGRLIGISRIKTQGQKFLKRIQELQKTLEVQGEALDLIKEDINHSPHRLPKSNLDRETASQRIAAENLRRHLEAKKAIEAAK
jgi:hypothetical protein